MNAKETFLKLTHKAISRAQDDVTLDDLLDALEVEVGFEEGEREFREGKFLTLDESLRQIERHFKSQSADKPVVV